MITISEKPMLNTFTEEDLLLLVYNELDEPKASELREEIKVNGGLYKEYCRIKEIIEQFEPLQFDPDPTSVSICLEYSGHFSAEQHEI